MRHAVRTSVARYNAEWLIEKNGLRSPSDARIVWDTASMKVAAYQQRCVQKAGYGTLPGVLANGRFKSPAQEALLRIGVLTKTVDR